MGSRREARILKSTAETIVVDGKTYTCRPIVAKHLMDLEQAALDYFKDQMLKTYGKSANYLDPATFVKLFQEKLEKVALMDMHDLPQRDAYDVSKIPINDKLKAWYIEKYDELPDIEEEEVEEDLTDDEKKKRVENAMRAVIATALDNEEIDPLKIKELTGKRPRQGKIRYDQWWVTASMEGMLSFICTSLQYEKADITREDIAKWPYAKIAEAARLVESITSAEVKNT